MSRGNSGQLLALKHLFERAFEQFHDRTALYFRDEQLTYADVGAGTAQLASVFRSLGPLDDDRVGVLMTNRPAFLISHIATIRAGVTIVPFNAQLTDDEWVPTSTVGFFDNDGHLHVFDRLQDVITRDGEPVYSTTIEDVLQRHPDVKQVGVIGVPENGQAAGDTAQDQLVKAVVVPRDTAAAVDIEDRRPLCTEHTWLDVPDSIDVVGTLPKTPYGKIDKQALKDPFW